MTTKPDIFIIESLNPDDEGNGRFEGPAIAHVARLHGKQPIYRYVRTRKQFAAAVAEFLTSGYRYLHVSAHANRDGLATTNQDDVSNVELAEMLGTSCGNRRLFLSACKMVHKGMAADIIPPTRCLSVVGTRRKVSFEEAVVFWPALYHLMWAVDAKGMKRKALASNLSKVAALFNVNIGYFARSGTEKAGFTRDILKA
jgi:hypothetical protein